MIPEKLEAAGCTKDAAFEAAQLAGRVTGVVSVLRGTIHHAQQGNMYLPLDLCKANNVHPSAVVKGQFPEGMQPVVQEIAHRASSQISEVRSPLFWLTCSLKAIVCFLTDLNTFHSFSPEAGFTKFVTAGPKLPMIR